MDEGDGEDHAWPGADGDSGRSGNLGGGPGQRHTPHSGGPGDRDPYEARGHAPRNSWNDEPDPPTMPVRPKVDGAGGAASARSTGPAGPTGPTGPTGRGRRRRRWPLVTGYSVLGLVSLLVLGLTGFAWATYNSVNDAVHKSDVISSNKDQTSVNGDTNILIMGLDTRLDENGNPLPQNIYDALHAGDGSDGGNNANVLMLLHVPGNGSQATEISIPRDDYVDLPGCPDGTCKEKIKQAYGLAMDQEARLLVKQGIPDSPAREQQERDAGRQEEIKTVSQFLGGVAIDHFVEVTLVAFYEIAQVVAPIPVCVLYPTSDNYSGANFQAGQQELNAAQALAFVRQRRDVGVASGGRIKDYYTEHGLNFTDLDRERRQQAFIASLAYKLKQAGTITSPSQLEQILNVAEANIAVDSGLNLLQFAQQASNLTGGNVTFHTLPVESYPDLGGSIGDVNEVNVPEVQADVRSLLGGGPDTSTSSSAGAPTTTTSTTPPPSGTVEVYNASGQAHIAGTVETALVGQGFTRGSTGNSLEQSSSVVEYGTDSSAATAAATALGGLTTKHVASIPAGYVRVILGRDFSLPAGMSSAGPTPTSTAPLPSQSAPSNNGNNDADNDPMSSISGGGVPCVK